MKIPVFHDDQHGTAIIVAAAVKNALSLTGKRIDDVKIVTSGAGAAALACLNLLVSLGARRENIWVTDVEGVVYEGRPVLMDRWKSVYAQKTDKRKLADVIAGADIFLGLSAPAVLKPEMVKEMAARPLIMALANPTPEIMPEEALKARPDALICTGRSDYPNQVNNVLCFPYIFRGALDVGATEINEAMKIAAVEAIAALAREAPSEVAARAYGGEAPTFGPGSLIPNPFDPRLILRIAPALAEAAMASGVATRPIADMDAYRARLNEFVFRSGFIMKPLFAQAKSDPKRVVYAEGEDERVLRATQVVVEEGLAKPILIGRPAVIEARLERFGLAIRPERDFVLINPQEDPRYRKYVDLYIEAAGRRGVTPGRRAHRDPHQRDGDRRRDGAGRRRRRRAVRRRGRLHGPPAPHPRSHRHRAGGRRFRRAVAPHHRQGQHLPRRHPGAAGPDRGGDRRDRGARRRPHPPVRHRAADRARLPFRLRQLRQPRPPARCGRATALLWERKVDFEVDGEMHADSALDPQQRERVYPHSRLKGAANVLILPTLDAANIAYEAIKTMADALAVGPILIGTAKPGAYPHAVGDGARHRQHDGGRGRRSAGLRGVALIFPAAEGVRLHAPDCSALRAAAGPCGPAPRAAPGSRA